MTIARERVLETAEQLFSERGYAAVTLRDIAQALGMKHASLYYHVPGGKEALFVEVTTRSLERHRAGLEAAISSAGPDVGAQLGAAARWLLSQPALNFARMLRSDMPAIAPQHAHTLEVVAAGSLIRPLDGIFRQIRPADAGIFAGAFLSIIEGIHNLPAHFTDQPKEAMADKIIVVLVKGLEESA